MDAIPNAEKEAERRRLAWRCRRGLLELDIVLKRFVAEEFLNLTKEEMAELDQLLDLPDNDFWQLIVDDAIGESMSSNLINLLSKLRGDDSGK